MGKVFGFIKLSKGCVFSYSSLYAFVTKNYGKIKNLDKTWDTKVTYWHIDHKYSSHVYFIERTSLGIECKLFKNFDAKTRQFAPYPENPSI